MRRPPLAALLALVLALALAGCGSDEERKSPGRKEERTAATTAKPRPAPAARCLRVRAPRPKPRQRLPRPTLELDPDREYSAIVDTSCGRFTIALDVERAPKTTASFVHMARRGLYDGTIFHRIVPGFVIQGGDPQGTGQGGPGYSVVEEPPSDLRYVKGVVAMAKTGVEEPGTSGSQFYVVTAPVAQLPPEYALVGRVTAGMDVVERIGVVPTDQTNPDPARRDRPLTPVVLRSVRIGESR